MLRRFPFTELTVIKKIKHSIQLIFMFLALGASANTPDTPEEWLRLRSVSEIMYDRYVEDQPWGDSYFIEAADRWSDLQSNLCEKNGKRSERFCSLPGIGSDGEWIRTALAFEGATLRDEFSAIWKNGEQPLYVHFAKIPQMRASENGIPVFNIVAGTKETLRHHNYAGFDFYERQIPVRELQDQVLVDLDTHRKAMELRGSSTFFLLSDTGPIVLMDLVKEQSRKFALQWKRMAEDPDPVEISQLYHLDAFMARVLASKERDQLSRAHRKIQNRYAAAGESEMVARFHADWMRFQWDEEVYTQITEDTFRSMIVDMALYHHSARKHRDGQLMARKVWESLLGLQTKHDARLVLYLIHAESRFSKNILFHQFVSPAFARAYFHEMMKAILDQKEYADRGNFEKYQDLVMAPEILEPGFIRAEAPELAEILGDRTVADLSLQERQEFFTRLLWDGEHLRPNVLHLMGASMIQRGTDTLLKDLAVLVSTVRRTDLRSPP